MPFSEDIPEAGITTCSGHVEVVRDNRGIIECSYGDASDNAKSSTTTSSQGPEKVLVLVRICSDQGSLSQNCQVKRNWKKASTSIV